MSDAVPDVVKVSSVIDDLTLAKNLRGRRQIFSEVESVTDENVVEVLTKALPIHLLNRREELFLKNYEKGDQPILHRYKQYNSEINNTIVVNIANEIVTFKTSEFAGEPIQYVSRGDRDEKIPEKVAAVNDMMISEGKQTKDLKLAHEMFTCGVGYRLAIHDSGRKDEEYLDEN